MNRRYSLSSVVCLVLTASLALAGCASMKGAAKKPALYGMWDYSMFNPSQGTLTGVITLEQAEDGSHTGHVTVREMGIDEAIVVKRVEIDGAAFTFDGMAAGTDFVITGTVEGDAMNGENDVAGVGIFTMTATRITQ